jgi:hypothetical protein
MKMSTTCTLFRSGVSAIPSAERGRWPSRVYRADEFFGAIDGGIDKPKSENLGFSGPFATINFGIGG